MSIKERRPVLCYGCGQVLGRVESTLGPSGMAYFREKARELRAQHQCAVEGKRAQ